jgi:TPR repeat protein
MRCRPLALLLSLAVLSQPREEQPRPQPSADLVNGINAYNRGDFATARNLLQAAADRGEPEAMVNLGYMYARRHGVRSAQPTRSISTIVPPTPVTLRA